ncbi:MAG: 30S ribosomal protein S6 [Deltaproteobacteria bacterium]|nr:30S ribosomal protein S6 [Deltaproteobacteria bacterium]
MRRYETIFITLAELSPEELDTVINRYKTIITSLNGVVVRVDIWGKRKLAYLIKKRHDGIYVLIDFVGESAVRAEFERNLKYDESILRYQSVKLSDTVNMEDIEREIADAEKEAVVDDVSSEDHEMEETKEDIQEDDVLQVEKPLTDVIEDAVTDNEKRGEE